MEEILIIALLIGGAYYLITQQNKSVEIVKKSASYSQSTQTNPITFANSENNKDLEKSVDILLQNIRTLNRQIK